MRVLHFSTARTWRGGEQQISYLHEYLKNEKQESFLFVARDSAIHENYKEDTQLLTYRKTFPLDPFISMQLKKWCKELKIDIVHAHDAHAHTFAVMAARFGMKTPIVLHRRVDFPLKNNGASLRKYNHPSIKAIVCVSSKIAEIIAPKIKDKEKIKVIHSGVDLKRMFRKKSDLLHKAFGLDADIKLVGNVAALADHKDHHTFLKTASLLKKNSLLHFFIVGDGEMRESIEDKIIEYNLENRVHLLGYRNDVPELMSCFDVFLFTSKEEGLGTSILDAMASGIPVVTTDAGGITDIAKHRENALVAKTGDATALAAYVSEIFDKKELAKDLVESAFTSLKDFTREEMGRKNLELYFSILSGKNKAEGSR